jgi:SAM-dependent methyltransferase
MHDNDEPFGKTITNMFGFPRGVLGRLGGWLMALEHSGISSFVVDLLAVEPEDRILEIGCGPGTATKLVAARATSGLAAAVDPSRVMVAQARRRLRSEIKAGRAEVAQAPAEQLPFDDESFTGALAIFTVHHWSDALRGLREILRVLRPGGRLVIAEHTCGHGEGRDQDVHSPSAMSDDFIAGTAELLTDAGFADIERSEQRVGKRKLAILTARR